MIIAKRFLLYSYPVALIASAASVYFFTQPIEYPSIHLGPVFAYLISLVVQVLWLIFMLSGRIPRESGVEKLSAAVNVLGVVCSAIGMITYWINGEVYGINIDLVLGPICAVAIAIILLLLLTIGSIERRLKA